MTTMSADVHSSKGKCPGEMSVGNVRRKTFRGNVHFPKFVTASGFSDSDFLYDATALVV